jgi:hypothetical protein
MGAPPRAKFCSGEQQGSTPINLGNVSNRSRQKGFSRIEAAPKSFRNEHGCRNGRNRSKIAQALTTSVDPTDARKLEVLLARHRP